MTRVSCVTYFGDTAIQIEADSVLELIKKKSLLEDMAQATEGRTCTPFYRKTADGYEYFGFRDTETHEEVVFGKNKKETADPDEQFFAYRVGYVNDKNPNLQYKGFQSRRQMTAELY